MARTCQQISRTLAPVHEPIQEQTQNNQHSTVDEDEHARRLTHIEWDVDLVRTTVEQMEAILMNLAQNINSQVLRQIEHRWRSSTKNKTWKDSYTKGKIHKKSDHSPQVLVSASIKMDEATSGQRVQASQRTSSDPGTAKTQRTGETPGAVQMQWTGENPMAKVARSHTPIPARA